GAYGWSVTSYTELAREALAIERWTMLHPLAERRTGYLEGLLAAESYPVVAASDYMKAVAGQLAPFVPAGFWALGTDGFGRSDERAPLRRFFEVDAESITVAALYSLVRRGEIEARVVAESIADLGLDPEKVNPVAA